MSYIFEFIITGTGTVNIYRNGVLKATAKGGQSSKVVQFERGDTFRQECLPAADFEKSCDQFGICTTDPNYTATIIVQSLYVRVIFTFKRVAPSCSTLAVNTWKPATVSIKSGESVSFTVRSQNPYTNFDLYYQSLAGTQTIISAKTDSAGCYTGTIQPLPDGEYLIYMCYPVLSICTSGFAQIHIRWGAKTLDIATMIMYAALGLGVAYVLGQVIAKDGR